MFYEIKLDKRLIVRLFITITPKENSFPLEKSIINKIRKIEHILVYKNI